MMSFYLSCISITKKLDLTNSDLSTDISIAKLLKHVYEGVDANKYGFCTVLDLKKTV